MEKRNELVVKEVEFNGDSLLAIQENSTGKIYVGVNWVCTGLGMDAKGQRDKIKFHEVLSKGWATLPLPSSGGNQDTSVIELDFLPLWLANINPKLVREDVKQKLIEYQLKAKDVLAEAFLNKPKLPQTYKEALVALLNQVEENERLQLENQEMKPKADGYDTFMNGKNNQDMNQVAKSLNVGRNKLFAFLRNNEILMKNNLPYQRYINSGYFDVIEVPIKKGIYVVNETKTVVTPKGVEYINKMLKEVDYKI